MNNIGPTSSVAFTIIGPVALGKNVTKHQAQIFGSNRTRRHDKFTLFERKKLSSHQTCRVVQPKKAIR